MFDSILIVCTGNICRSPIAERLLRCKFQNKIIDSAGTGALIDHAADNTAIEISKKYGLDLSNHKGRQITSAMIREYDLILVMEKGHIEKICTISPESRGKTMLLGHWIDIKEIPDPYRKSNEAFDSVYKLIEKACNSWVEKINA